MARMLVDLAYLLAAVLFIVGLKQLAHPRTAVRGNLLGALGMLIAVVVTLGDRQIIDYRLIAAGLVAGSAAGAWMALRVGMTAMPQMVALLNGFGGAASTLVGGAALYEALGGGGALGGQFTIATGLTGLIGAVTFWGSLVAWAKLEGRVSERAVLFPGQKAVNLLVALVALALVVAVALRPEQTALYWWLAGVSSVLGVLLVVPIGGADMPVVISLLNSYSGMAACATGFVLSNSVLIISGALVGASGIILTSIMCRAMNRSLGNVLFGGVGAAGGPARAGGPAGPGGSDAYGGKVKAIAPEEVALLLETARRVVFVPGYGMAVAQAQHAVRALGLWLEQRGVVVEYAIHPVAGRMPGHMNVLLAEADVPYEQLKEMDEVNPGFAQTDVAIVIGANDVVNPLARTDPASPIAGMPILDVDRARTVVVIKRSLSPGFAGIPNPLFAADNAYLLFADAKQGINAILAAMKEAGK